MFKLTSDFKPTGDQPHAIRSLTEGITSGLKNQVLLGVTGSGKTFTMANMIQQLNMPALVISHNKTLAGQLYQEMRDFFPQNAVSYFVSYYDYYQPEAYIPQTDTYIEKEADINELIDKLRLQATANIMTRKDVVVVASVSCIYNIGSAEEYGKFTLEVKKGDNADWNALGKRLIELLYERSEFDFKRGSYRVRGPYVDIYPAYEDFGYRINSKDGFITLIEKFEPLSGKILESGETLKSIIIYPAKHYLMDPSVFKPAEAQIRNDLKQEYTQLKKDGKLVEAERLLRRVNYDLEMIKEVGYTNGIENYSRYFDGRKPGEPPYTLLDYFRISYKDNFLVFIDESHMTVPQIRGMYNGDHARKKTLIDFGFRLNAAFDNRPLTFDEFYEIPPHMVYVSATPNEWEIEKSKQEIIKSDDRKAKLHEGVVEQLIRPTGIIDPKITIRPAKNEVQDLIKEVEERVKRKEKILVTTLTKKMAEDLSDYLKERNIRASYLHSDIHTLERSDVLDNLRKNEFDVLIGVNLLREGLDLPEVFLVAILDADKEGFLRSKTALIQTMGRAARNISGEVIMYADVVTNSIKGAINEIDRRREHQREYNKKHNIKPKTIMKPIREKIAEKPDDPFYILNAHKPEIDQKAVADLDSSALTGYDKKRVVKKLEREMRRQVDDMNFEFAIAIRDKIRELRSQTT
ncbi:excinuclease ABC subunit B [Candidatus Roizmanbacteria bacterium RIFCSPLOWO2_01_FULL_40_42]|uniref:UvrABC system protein B n=1 Tax=Candidatus Roizmanbacteria bacterium RIFCSPLOWO2_01_FULL_40_42 TaxID=1802066 RepID=A0A1F7J2D2_9BACT|nr:MAG: excinuclease ABC subunit B [Candidatus Roizmanbacteria bacterium RIFCSPHIGHO2_01_FULL_40_98]OGK27762.1 MAG: excinuclease ABC subunit B [Candidatus Roizmanbacteria bacterium RIFCSPHIGHO2_02_FULL_40_53]OGK30687.1 MAG: excinuclease ABC subunit B [Candidatus Roizmanbacteria bacterium RIFCSPHIGHO2_12_41_18]OGK36509.1 MAG: excinuclease ABC subunit B [Candidatus Roizmanbacteria bacterium RIFCSPHIGHO2_12_FULL_40_130]OGK49771.1 MAG: excinuclease ABC subunit B [Candidatus Roizmanbacteria bacteriu